jgi:two-component system, OmpR family, phosphate regulon sensor histidine kinase PhoR
MVMLGVALLANTPDSHFLTRFNSPGDLSRATCRRRRFTSHGTEMVHKMHTSADAKLTPGLSAALRPHSWPLSGKEQSQDICTFESVLLAIAGHDLRQSLQVVQGANDLLGTGLRSASELRYLRSSQKAVDRLNEQLSELLTALRLRLHANDIKLKPVRVQQLLEQVSRENEEAAQQKNISLRMVPTNALVMSDVLLLGAALRNLVSNAIRYTQAGGRIVLGCRRGGSCLRIEVCDTGIGISEEQMPKIFDAFTRLDPGRNDSLGVGLFIVRHAIGLLGHRIEVASTPSRGSRFSILAPYGRTLPNRRQPAS